MRAVGQIRAGVEQMQRDTQIQAPPCTREEARTIAAELLRQRDANDQKEEIHTAVQSAHWDPAPFPTYLPTSTLYNSHFCSCERPFLPPPWLPQRQTRWPLQPCQLPRPRQMR